jgi:hypothetical protein
VSEGHGPWWGSRPTGPPPLVKGAIEDRVQSTKKNPKPGEDVELWAGPMDGYVRSWDPEGEPVVFYPFSVLLEEQPNLWMDFRTAEETHVYVAGRAPNDKLTYIWGGMLQPKEEA